MLRHHNEISNDLHMLNSLERCFNTSDVMYSTSAEFMIAHVFKQDKTLQYQNLMMNIMPYMIEEAAHLKEYAQFFSDANQEDDQQKQTVKFA